MKKKLHLICNAHLDPVWQWEWEEGAAAAISTFRVAAKFCREFDGFIFCHNEALLYQWIEEYEPALFAEIQALVKLGKWHIMGGWQLQPDCNMPSGEGFVRNIMAGRKYFKEKFGVVPTTAINFDPFGNSRGLVQILAKSGFDSYLFCRPTKSYLKLPSNTFSWRGYDGSEVKASRAVTYYSSALGKSTEKIDAQIKLMNENGFDLDYCLWGVGNHGGGPSHKDLCDISAKMCEWEKEGVEVVHSTPETFFGELSKDTLPVYEKDLNPWAVGCYTSQVRIKQKYRQLENMLFSCEKMCAALEASTSDFVYPEKEIGQAVYDMLTVQFHDILPGSSIQPAEESAIRTLDHALEILSRVRARAFFRLSQGQKAAKTNEIPIIVYNPHPYPVERDVICEFMLADQNGSGTWTIPQVYDASGDVACQLEKEDSNIPFDWRKRVVFHTTLPPMQISRFDCRLNVVEKKPTVSMPSDETHYLFDNGSMQVKISKKTGLVDYCAVNGVEYLAGKAMSIDVYHDDEDPWGMLINGWRERIGSFKLLSSKKGTALSALKEEIASVRVVENGDVRCVVEAVFGYGSSSAIVRYLLSKKQNAIDLQIRIVNAEKKKLFKLSLPCAAKQVSAFAEVAYGEEPFKLDGVENVHQKYVRLEDPKNADRTVNVYNKGTYGSSLENNRLLITLMRSPAYTAHPVKDLPILPTDRHSPYIEQGERLFDFKLTFGRETLSNGLLAQTYNEEPYALSFFPSGDGDAVITGAPLRVDGGKILVSAFKKAETKSDTYLLRLFNPESASNACTVRAACFDIEKELTLGGFEVKSFFLSPNGISECSMVEDLEKE